MQAYESFSPTDLQITIKPFGVFILAESEMVADSLIFKSKFNASMVSLKKEGFGCVADNSTSLQISGILSVGCTESCQSNKKGRISISGCGSGSDIFQLRREPSAVLRLPI